MGRALVRGVLRWDSETDLKLSPAEHCLAIQSLPLLIWHTKAVAACKGGHKQQAAGGDKVLPFGGVEGVVKAGLGGWA